jgi:hypothetical protein
MMALVDARIRRSAKISEAKDSKGVLQLSGSQDFLVISDTPNPTFASVLDDSTSWPKIGGPLPKVGDLAVVGGKSLRCTSREVSFENDSDRVLLLSVKYSVKEEEDEDPPEGTEPDTWQRITIRTEQMTEPAQGWVTFNRAVAAGPDEDFARNSAGDPVDGLEEDTAMARLTYTNTQVEDPDFAKLLEYTNTCNSVEFLGGREYSVRCMGWSGEYDQKNNVWSISAEFLYNPNDWSIEFYDVGFNEIVNGKRRAIVDLAGNPVSKPVPLDGNGQAVPIDPGGGPDEENFQPVALNFRYLYPYRAIDMRNFFTDCRI